MQNRTKEKDESKEGRNSRRGNSVPHLDKLHLSRVMGFRKYIAVAEKRKRRRRQGYFHFHASCRIPAECETVSQEL